MINRNVLIGLFLLTAILLFSGMAAAVNVGVSPATLSFKNVLRGGYAHGSVVVSVDSPYPVRIAANATGDVASWLNFTSNFSSSVNNPYVLGISVTPPDNMPNGNYTGFVRIETLATNGTVPGQAVGIIHSTLDVYIKVEVVDTQVLQCSAGSFSVQSVEQGDDAVFNVNVTNQGNVIINPKISIKVWDENQTKVVKEINTQGGNILPTLKKQISIRMNTADFPISQYWADVSVDDCLASNLLTFDVLQPGALKADGIFLNLLSSPNANVGDTVPIIANFKNTGEKEVSAEFKGQITKSGRIVQLLDSPVATVPINQLNTFNFYFTPKSPGEYIITGRIYYSGKQSYELSTKVEVAGSSVFSFILPVVYAILVFAIAFLFVKIVREKRAYKRRLRRLRK